MTDIICMGEQLQCTQECRNAKDPFAVAVLNGSDIVGPIPRKTLRLCWLEETIHIYLELNF